MKQSKVPNVRKQKPISTTARLDAAPPMDANATPFSPSENEVAFRAYLNYQNHGAAEGNDVQDWLRAESELIAEHRSVGV